MMVFEQTSMAMSNKTVPIISQTQTKLDVRANSTKSGKSLPTRGSSFKQKRSLTKSVSSTLEKTRATDTLKKTVSKELKSSKHRSRSESPAARSASSKIGSKDK